MRNKVIRAWAGTVMSLMGMFMACFVATENTKAEQPTSQTVSTNAVRMPSVPAKEQMYVDIVEKGSRQDTHAYRVLGEILECLGYWDSETTVDEAFFRKLVDSAKPKDETAEYLNRCLLQHTLSPTSDRPRSITFGLEKLVFAPQKNPVRLGPYRDGSTRTVITLSWRNAGTYGVGGGPGISVDIPDCQVEMFRSDGTKVTETFRPEMKSSYSSGWPIVDASQQIRNYVVLFLGKHTKKE